MSLRRLVTLSLSAALAAVLLVGCMNLQSELTIRSDGSGTVTERVVVSPQFAQMIRSMGQGDGDSDEMFEEADLRARADTIDGLRVESVRMISGSEGEGYEAVFAFDNLDDVQFDPGPSGDVMPDAMQQSQGEDAGNNPFDLLSSMEYSFTPGSPATLTIGMPRDDAEMADVPEGDMGEGMDGEEDADDAGPSDQEMQMMRMMLADTRIRVAVTVDGEIVETNATHRTGSTITLVDMNFSEIVRDTSAFRTMMRLSDADDEMDPQAMADSMNALPGIVFETNETVTVRFR